MGHDIAIGVRPVDRSQNGRIRQQLTERLMRRLRRLGAGGDRVVADRLGRLQAVVHRFEDTRRVLGEHFRKAQRRALGLSDRQLVAAVEIRQNQPERHNCCGADETERLQIATWPIDQAAI
jgi:hypothetical protein